MFSEATRRACLVLAAAACALASARAEPAKPAAARRSFDFTPPRPGEMLPNPTAGVGRPPTLAQFRPTAILDPGPAAAAPTAATASPQEAGQPASGRVMPTSDQTRFAKAIARLGIDGALRPGVPDLDAASLRALRASLALLPPSLADAPEPSGRGPVPNPEAPP